MTPKTETAIKIIPDLGTALVTYVKARLAQKLKKSIKPEAHYQGGDVHKFGDGENGYICLVVDGEIVYFVKYKRIKFNGTRYARQVLVWRESSAFSATGFADFVFFKKLLPTFNCLVSDELQTEAGKRFWQFAVKKAVQEHLYVYLLDRAVHPNSLLRLASIEDIIEHTKELWGKTERDRRRLLVISTTAIKLKAAP